MKFVSSGSIGEIKAQCNAMGREGGCQCFSLQELERVGARQVFVFVIVFVFEFVFVFVFVFVSHQRLGVLARSRCSREGGLSRFFSAGTGKSQCVHWQKKSLRVITRQE